MLITPKLENRFIVHAFHLLHNFYARVHIFFSFLKSRLCVANLDRNKLFYYSFRVSACIYGFSAQVYLSDIIAFSVAGMI